MLRRSLVFLFMIICLTGGANAQEEEGVKILKRTQKRFTNKNCQKNQTCSLREISFTVEDYSADVEGLRSFGTSLVAHFETHRPENLEDYAFVQFILGCKYTVRLQNGMTKVTYEEEMSHFGKTIPFRFPKWVIDVFDTEPTYPMDNGAIYDNPGVAFYPGVNDAAYNTALKFRTCLYKESDVPKEIKPDNVNFAKPIVCFEWDSIYIYDFKAKQFKRGHKIPGECK